eukprot:SAG22_NODE_323_length_12378_cov_19.294975_1_plen_139_part_00
MDLEAQLAQFKKEQEAKQAEEMAGFMAKLKREEEEKKAAAAAAADPNPGFAQSYVDEKLKAQADRHARAMAGLKEKHAREIQEKKDKHVAAVALLRQQWRTLNSNKRPGTAAAATSGVDTSVGGLVDDRGAPGSSMYP